ncbi:Methyl-CpG-binding domain protein 5 [Mactra antiquata]
MDNSGLVALNFGMNVANSQGSATSQIVHQLPAIQQVFTQNTALKSGDGAPNIVQQTVLPVNNTQQTGNPTVLATAAGLQFVGQPSHGFLGPQQQQTQLLTQQTGTQQILGPRSMYAANYQIMPRNFALFNQGIQGPTGVAVQLSPQQIGAATLSPLEQQQQFFQSAGFDSQLGTIQQQNQQQITFQNANCQFMIQSPSQQLMLQSPNQQFALPSPSQQFTVQNQNQFTVQGHNITQFNPQHHILTQGQGNNVIVQNQAGGMILHGDNFVSQGPSQNVFVPNPSIVQNVNPQMYGTAQNVLANQIPGLISQAQVVTNQNLGIISVSHSIPAPNGNGDNTGKSNTQNSGITNEQMQLLAHIANHSTDVTNSNLSNQPNIVQQVTSQNQSLPSFGHFLLHHHMQSLPHPFLQNLSISTMATDDSSRKPVGQQSMNVPPQTNTSGIVTINVSTTSESSNPRTSVDNINAEFNHWNIGQFVNQSAVTTSNPISNVNTQQLKGADVKISVQTLCSSKVSKSVHCPQIVSTTTNVLIKGLSQSKPCTSDTSSMVRTVSMGVDTVKPSHIQHEKSPQSVITTSHGSASRNTIIVPYGWVRALEGDTIVYYSPTCTRLTSSDSVKQYLATDGTCKCGLECPLHVDTVFNFNSDVISIKWNPSFSNIKDAGTPCNHKRKYSAISSSQTVRSFGITRPEVSMVTSSGLMSPRVSSTVQEVQALIDGNKRRKLVQEDVLTSNDTNSSTLDLTTNVKQVGTSEPTVIKDTVKHSTDVPKTLDKNMDTVVAMDNSVSTSMLSSTTNNSDEVEVLDTGEQAVVNKSKLVTNETDLREKADSGRTVLKDINRSIPKSLILNEAKHSNKNDMTSGNSKKIDAICSRLGDVVSGISETMKTESVVNLKSPTSVKSDRSSSRGSIHSKHTADTLSPRSDRNASSKTYETSGNDPRFTAEMLSHFMNFCGFPTSNMPPIIQQNMVGIPGMDAQGKDSTGPGFPAVTDAIQYDLMKLPVMPQSSFGPLQANILANLHKLSSPPNQQVFPALNLPGLPKKHTGSYHPDVKMGVHGNPHGHNIKPSLFSSFPSSVSITSPGLISPSMSDILLLSPSKKSRSKKCSEQKVDSSKNIESLFDSDEPPPNVDVSQLKDKGHGPIPKEKIASFIEESVEFSKQECNPNNKTISSTTSSPVNDGRVSKETCPNDNQSEKTRSDSACSDRLNSPCPMDRDATEISENVSNVQAVPAVHSSILSKESNSFNPSCIVNTGTKACVSLIHQLANSSSIVQSIPVASAPPTPTTVVHHTPGSLSCHQMSLIKARQHALGLKDGMKDLSTESLLHPLAAILSDPTIGQVFQQMFPEVAQQVLMHSVDIHKSTTPDMAVDSTGGVKTKKTSATTTAVTRSSASSTLPASSSVNASYQKPSFQPQTIMSNIPQGDFPASTLLSAAAKAQLEFQQNQFGMLMAQQLQRSLPETTMPSQITRNLPMSNPSVIHTASVMPNLGSGVNVPLVSVSKQGSIPATTVTFTSLDTPLTSVAGGGEKFKPRVGTQKISELLNRNKPPGHSDVEIANLLHLLQKPDRQNLHGTDIPKVSHIVQASQIPVTSTTTISHVPVNVNNASQTMPMGHLVGQGQGQNVDVNAVNLMHMYNTLGLPLNCDFMNQKPLLRAAVPSAETSVQRTSLNQFVPQTGSQFPCNVSGPAASLPLLVQQSDLNNTNIVQNPQHFVPVLDAGTGGNQVFNLQGMQSTNVQGLLQPTHFSIPTMSVGNEGVLPKQINQGLAVPASIADTAHNPVLIGNNMAGSSTSTPDVINLLNMQQTIGSGTNLTAMQLQTLQLQQQLLQQLQQVQGMQNLISQYNLHNQTVTNTPGGTKKKSPVPVAQGGASTSLISCNTQNSLPLVSNNTLEVSSTVGDNVGQETSISESNFKVSSAELECQGLLRKSCSVRVIAAADTTEDCSSKTVDIGTETDAFVEDNSESDLDEPANSEGNTTSKSDEEMGVDHHEVFDTNEEKVDSNVTTVDVNDETNTVSPVISPTSRKTMSVNTCLAIATQKGNSRSSEIESRVFSEKSSLARSQNLSAELTKPTGGELKLRIKRKHLFHSDISHDIRSRPSKRNKLKERKSQSYLIVKKALRSSTLAATKASSSLAAKYSSKDKIKDLVKKPAKVSSEMNVKATPTTSTVSDKSVHLPNSSSESYECDSSIDSQTGSSSETTDKEPTEKYSITSRIAAALSSQKGLWQLSQQRKTSATDEGVVDKASGLSSSVSDTGRKRTRLDDGTDNKGNDGVEDKSLAVSCSFNTGDLVWGQIRGFPSWPGKLVEKTEMKGGESLEEGKVLVKWFGDNTITQVEPSKLKTLSEGLEAHHRARKKHRRGRKMNSNLEQAIQHAMTELDKQTASIDHVEKSSNVSEIVAKSVKAVKQKK